MTMHSQTANCSIQTTGVSKPQASRLLQRKCACGEHDAGLDGECAECRKKKLQRRAGSLAHSHFKAEGGAHAPPVVHEVLTSMGAPLDESLRRTMEARFGHDFSRVRIHTGARAAESAQAVNALAYTVGQDIVFDAGQFAPATRAGKRLLAHELAHTVQQSSAGVSAVAPYTLEVTAAQSAAEMECDAIAERVVNASLTEHEPPPVMQSIAPSVQRAVSPKLPRIQYLLRERGRGEKKISAQDVHEALEILSWLSEEDLRDTVAEMEKGGYVDRFFLNLSEDDQRAEFQTLRRIKNSRVWTTTQKQGSTTVTTTVVGSCMPSQYQEIFVASNTALGWLDRAVSQLDAYLAAPTDAKNEPVGRALKLHFHSTANDVVQHIRGRLNFIRNDIRGLKGFEIECHGFWDKSCSGYSAYVETANRERIVFCNNYFGESALRRALAIVHEMAHAQAGGIHINDRAYQNERLIHALTTPEALTNAESYGLLVQQLGTGSVPSLASRKDTSEDCPDRWWQMLQRATGIAQRWVNSAQASFAVLRAQDVKNWSPQLIGYLGGKTDGDVGRARGAFNSIKSRLEKGIDFECEPKGGGRCDTSAVYWYALGDYHICPSWVKIANEGDRVELLLAGLYGYTGIVGNDAQQNNYAKLAREFADPAAPAMEEVLGGTKWDPDFIGLSLTPKEPKAAKYAYYEDGKFHQRLSDDLPVYQGPAGTSSTLPFHCTVEFQVDEPVTNHRRPAPFTPPTVSLLFEFDNPNHELHNRYIDPRPYYPTGGGLLETKFMRDHWFSFKENGAFHMRFELDDPDTNIKRVYDDTIQIEAVR